MRTCLGFALALAFALTARMAGADNARGKQLFEEGRAAMGARDFPTACAKFEASFEASSVPGALLSCADCEESHPLFVFFTAAPPTDPNAICRWRKPPP